MYSLTSVLDELKMLLLLLSVTPTLVIRPFSIAQRPETILLQSHHLETVSVRHWCKIGLEERQQFSNIDWQMCDIQ